MKMIEDTIDSFNQDLFRELVESICKAETIYLFGLGRSNEPLVSYLGFRLSRFGKRIREIPYSGINMMEVIPLIGCEDLVVIYHFLKVSPDYYCLTNALRSVESKLFLITDNKKLDLVKAVDKVITVNRGPFDNYHTLTVPFAFTSAVILGVADITGEAAIDFTSKIGDLRGSYYRGMAESYHPLNENSEKGE